LRLNKTLTFSCPQTNDLYTLETNSFGNKKLSYPIGLIFADEVVYAGGVYDIGNYIYYLQNASNYWTQTPHSYSSIFSSAEVYGLNTSGSIRVYDVSVGYDVRPVISLKSDITITGGTGTLTDPWIVTP